MEKLNRLAGEEQFNARVVKLLELPAWRLFRKKLYNLETGLPGEGKRMGGENCQSTNFKAFLPCSVCAEGEKHD